MELYLHHTSTMFCLVPRGELAGGLVREMECAWPIAKSILRGRELVVDISGLTGADPAGLGLLFRMQQSGAHVVSTLPAEISSGLPRSSTRDRWAWGRLVREAIRATNFRHLPGRRHHRVALGGQTPPVSLDANME